MHRPGNHLFFCNFNLSAAGRQLRGLLLKKIPADGAGMLRFSQASDPLRGMICAAHDSFFYGSVDQEGRGIDAVFQRIRITVFF